QGGHEAADDALSLGEAADIGEGGLRLDLHLHAAGELGELLAELAEDLAQAPLDGPLLTLDVVRRQGGRALGRHTARSARPGCRAPARTSRRRAPPRRRGPSRGW